MANALVDRAPLAKLASTAQVIDKKGVLEDFCGFREVVERDLSRLAPDRMPRKWRQAPVHIKLAFGWADVRQRVPALEGRISAVIDAVCQRCLEPFELSLDVPLRLMLIAGGDAAVLEDYEIWETSEDAVRPIDIVEEALIMAMPLTATHSDAADCGPLARKLREAPRGTARPFADLKSRMRDERR